MLLLLFSVATFQLVINLRQPYPLPLKGEASFVGAK